MSWWEKRHDILGVNARNLLYVNRYNTKLNKNFADDKLHTKNYLQSRGIGVARLYAAIRNYKELVSFNPEVLPDNFVVKPNRGFGGTGITIIRDKKGKTFFGTGNKKYDWQDLFNECSAILDGKYAISGFRDQVIFEELLITHESLVDYVESGLPDIRIIVFNLVPIVGMLRLPTTESEGKANLHLGAVGLGIDIGTGLTTYGVQHHKFVTHLPNGKPVKGIKIPFWDELLLTAARIQQISQVGFLGVDLTVTKTGLKVLEINARAGLDIQIANRAPLKVRLRKVSDLKVGSPQEGVKIAKTLFTSNPKKIVEFKVDKPIIGLYEPIEVLNSIQGLVKAKIDPHAGRNILDSSFKSEFEDGFVSIKLAGKRINLPTEFGDLQKHNYKAILAGKFLSDFLIDTSITPSPKNIKPELAIGKGDRKEEKIIKNIDRKIYLLDKSLGIIPRFKPINLLQEQELFFQNKTYSPQFIYKKITTDLEAIKKELKKIPTKVDHPLMPFYHDKIREMNRKILLLEARGSEKIQYHSEKLYGRVSREMYRQAVDYITKQKIETDISEELPIKKIQKILEDYLKLQKLIHWNVVVVKDAAADISVSRRNQIFLKDGAKISENRLKALIAHEIETHIFRLENARLQSYKIFEVGTANYLTTEEGLAIYNQNTLGLPLGDKAIWLALNVVGVYLGRKLSFAELFDHLVKTYEVKDQEAFKICVKVKRGLSNTEKHTVFSRDLIYFNGLQLIADLVKQKGRAGIKSLYFGKIGVNDLPRLAAFEFSNIKYLPDRLK
ncbi:MAG: DUF1704 domain-containing protein [Candidatus Buchananbacteria bacterium]|nr:DUF1704 domain-containing protein [Candidatus Buchananbacteria bacterium]